MNEDIFKKVYNDLLNIFPPETDDPRFRYSKRTWIFPNHIDIGINFSRELTTKYRANMEICVLGSLLHDAGLAYKRDKADPSGHENRSIEYTTEFLPHYGYDQNVINTVIDCIKATEAEVEPRTLEEKIVRTADALAHILSVHYFVKVSFSPDWESGVRFLEKKVEKDWQKICFIDERERIRPIYNYLTQIVAQYRKEKQISIL